jgi:hypothetical protein
MIEDPEEQTKGYEIISRKTFEGVIDFHFPGTCQASKLQSFLFVIRKTAWKFTKSLSSLSQTQEPFVWESFFSNYV